MARSYGLTRVLGENYEVLSSTKSNQNSLLTDFDRCS